MPSEKHNQLTFLAKSWLEKNGFIVSSGESVIIGFGFYGSCIIKVETCRNTILADRAIFHKNNNLYSYDHRFYLCPEGLLQPYDIPNGWELLYERNRRIIPAESAQLL